MSIRCGQCGLDNADGATQCMRCNLPFNAQQAVPATVVMPPVPNYGAQPQPQPQQQQYGQMPPYPPPANPTPKKSNPLIWIAAIGGVLVLFVGVIGILGLIGYTALSSKLAKPETADSRRGPEKGPEKEPLKETPDRQSNRPPDRDPVQQLRDLESAYSRYEALGEVIKSVSTDNEVLTALKNFKPDDNFLRWREESFEPGLRSAYTDLVTARKAMQATSQIAAEHLDIISRGNRIPDQSKEDLLNNFKAAVKASVTAHNTIVKYKSDQR